MAEATFDEFSQRIADEIKFAGTLMNIRYFLASCLVLHLVGCASAPHTRSSRTSTSLFNGHNLDGWYVYLDGHQRNEDPGKIFQVRDGIIEVYHDSILGTKQPFGYLATEKEYENYDLKMEFKWGTNRFLPRMDKPRDCGLLFHFVGPDKIWPSCVEFQIQEGDVGDIYTAYTRVTSWLDPNHLAKDQPNQWNGSQFLRRENGGIERSQGGDWIARIRRSSDYEHTDWNTLELVVRGDCATYIVNGKLNDQCWNIRRIDPQHPGQWISIKKGKIMLQAEGAEVFYRYINLTTID